MGSRPKSERSTKFARVQSTCNLPRRKACTSTTSCAQPDGSPTQHNCPPADLSCISSPQAVQPPLEASNQVRKRPRNISFPCLPAWRYPRPSVCPGPCGQAAPLTGTPPLLASWARGTPHPRPAPPHQAAAAAAAAAGCLAPGEGETGGWPLRALVVCLCLCLRLLTWKGAEAPSAGRQTAGDSWRGLRARHQPLQQPQGQLWQQFRGYYQSLLQPPQVWCC